MRDPLEGNVGSARRALFIFVLFVAALTALGVYSLNALWTAAVILGLVLMIMVHEAGHYLTAKWAGMKVTEFFLGFGPRLWSFRRGETEYGVKAVPAGGYVRIIGMHNLEEVDPADEPRTYRSKPYRHRLLVAVAGSATHFLMAFVMLVAVFAWVGIPETSDEPVVGDVIDEVPASLAADGVERPSPASEAGLRPGDRILAVDSARVDAWEDVPALVGERPGDAITVRLERDGVVSEVRTTPLAIEREGEEIGFLGIAPAEVSVTRPLPTSVRESASTTWDVATRSVGALGSFFSPANLSRYGEALFAGEEPPDDSRIVSPVGAARLASAAVESGLFDVLWLLVIINVFVGIMNLVPLPPLDGGHAAVATYEKIASEVTGERVQVDMARVMPVAAAVIAVLLFLGLSALWLDIVRPLDVQF